MDREPCDLLIDLRLPSDPSYLALVRTVVAAAASAIPTLCDSRIGDLKLVATELFTNAMEANWRAAEEPDEARTIEVRLRCKVSATGIEVTVTDSGSGFSASNEPHPPVGDPNRLDFERGLGLPLIQYLADEVDYASSPKGTQATVVLRDRP